MLQYTCEGEDLVQCSTAKMKTEIVLLTPGRPVPQCFLQCPGTDFPRDAWNYDLRVVRKLKPPPHLPIHWHCPQPPCDVAQVCQTIQPNNIQCFKEFRVNVIHSEGRPNASVVSALMSPSWSSVENILKVCPQLKSEELHLVNLLLKQQRVCQNLSDFFFAYWYFSTATEHSSS